MQEQLQTAGSPGQVREGDEAVDEVKESPRDDDAVVDVEEEDDRHRGEPDALQYRHELPDEGGPPGTEVLSRGNLLHEIRIRLFFRAAFDSSRCKTWKKMGMPQANMAMK